MSIAIQRIKYKIGDKCLAVIRSPPAIFGFGRCIAYKVKQHKMQVLILVPRLPDFCLPQNSQKSMENQFFKICVILLLQQLQLQHYYNNNYYNTTTTTTTTTTLLQLQQLLLQLLQLQLQQLLLQQLLLLQL